MAQRANLIKVLVLVAVLGIGAGAVAMLSRGQAGVNVLVISLDTVRKDRLSCYGYERPTTPRLDALAEDGLLFTRCVAVSNWTLPTHASMLCGLYPGTHGAHRVPAHVPHVNPPDPTGRLPLSTETLTELLQANDYRTAAVVANTWFFHLSYQLNQGFDHYDHRPGTLPTRYRRASEITDAALGWLEQDSTGKPFFLFLNYMDPHVPYLPPPPYDTRFGPPGSVPQGENLWTYFVSAQTDVIDQQQPMPPEIRTHFRNRYDGEIAYMDEHIGRLLDWLRQRNLYDRTLVIVTADHGEAFGEHLVAGHQLMLYEPELAVPMIVKLPSSERRGRLDYGVQHVDIMPTVLDVLDMPVPSRVEGRSMLAPSQRDLVAEKYVSQWLVRRWPEKFNRTQHALYRGNLKYIGYSDGQQELFDLDADPAELNNLLSERSEEAEELRVALENWRKGIRPLAREQQENVAHSQDELDALRDLGYLAK